MPTHASIVCRNDGVDEFDEIAVCDKLTASLRLVDCRSGEWD